MFTRSPRSVVGLVLLASMSLSGCHGWRAQPNPPSGAQLPSPARITRTDESVLVLRDAAVSHDSIVGQVDRSGEAVRVAIPLSQVRSIDARRMDGARTALLGVGVLGGLLGLVVLAAANVPPGPGPY
jgi:hypothetical protein